MLLVGRQEVHLARKNFGVGGVISLEQDAVELHMVQLMPLPPRYLCFRKIENGLSF